MRLLPQLSRDGQSEEGSDSLIPARGASHQKKISTNDLRNIIRFFYVFAVLSVLAVVWYCGFTRTAAAPLLWGLACASVGAAFGFLFGIPKILQNERPLTEIKEGRSTDYRQQVNTNLTEISDWLTKIIVGLGLINLNNIPTQLNDAAQVLAVGLNSSDPSKDKAFAVALILCFLILGFLFGYLSTRLFLQAAFSRADQEAAVLRVAENVFAATEARISTLETKQEHILSAETTQPSVQDATAVDERVSDPLLTLRNIADSYLLITGSSTTERRRLKDQSASAMLSYIRSHKIPKDIVFREAERTGNEGMILALANYILNYPEQGDLDYLPRVADKVERLHVKYRVIQAIGELFTKNYVASADTITAERIFSSYEKGADQHLLSLIKGTRILVANTFNQEESLAK